MNVAYVNTLTDQQNFNVNMNISLETLNVIKLQRTTKPEILNSSVPEILIEDKHVLPSLSSKKDSERCNICQTMNDNEH